MGDANQRIGGRVTVARLFLLAATVIIYTLTVIATMHEGPNWPAVAVQDLMALNWRSQFNADFVLYLLIVAGWVSWREGSTARGYALGALSIVMGGMFLFPYLLLAIIRSKGDPGSVLLGARA